MLSTVARNLGRVSQRVNPIAPMVMRHLSAKTAMEAVPAKDFDRESLFADFDDAGLRSELNRLREIETDLVATVEETSPEINWDEWKAEIKYPGVVDDVKKMFDSVPVPDMEAEKLKAQKHVDSVFDPIIEEYRAMSEKSESDTAQLEKKMEETTFMRDNIAKLTVEEFLEKYPTIKASIEDDIKNNRWFVDA